MKCKVLEKRQCEITQGYSDNHNAVDIVGGGYTLDYVVAHSDGKVVFCQDGYGNIKGSTGNASYGNCVKIDHGNGYQTLYAHMRSGLSVKNGDSVKKGQKLGYMSDSGNAYGGHLHFEVWKDSKRIDPTLYINTDLPLKNNVTYQAYDNQLKKYWNEITNYNNINSNGYAGCIGHSIGGIRVKASKGTITIQSHIKGGSWLSPISKWDNTADGYSGIYGKDIDMVMIKSSVGTARYRVHLKGGNWLGWITQYNINDSVNGMAGIYGRSIDAIQIEII